MAFLNAGVSSLNQSILDQQCQLNKNGGSTALCAINVGK